MLVAGFGDPTSSIPSGPLAGFPSSIAPRTNGKGAKQQPKQEGQRSTATVAASLPAAGALPLLLQSFSGETHAQPAQTQSGQAQIWPETGGRQPAASATNEVALPAPAQVAVPAVTSAAPASRANGPVRGRRPCSGRRCGPRGILHPGARCIASRSHRRGDLSGLNAGAPAEEGYRKSSGWPDGGRRRRCQRRCCRRARLQHALRTCLRQFGSAVGSYARTLRAGANGADMDAADSVRDPRRSDEG